MFCKEGLLARDRDMGIRPVVGMGFRSLVLLLLRAW